MADEYDLEKTFQEKLLTITDENVKAKLNKIKECVVKRLNLEREKRVKTCVLEAKYEKQFAPLYVERSDIINGKVNVKPEELKDLLPDIKLESCVDTETGIPEFWLTCLKNSVKFGKMITPKDEKILKHLTNISLDYKESGDFTVFFDFSDNEYFGHKQLQREFILDEKKNIKRIESTQITWNSEEVNPTVEQKKKEIKEKEKSEVCESFFNFFKNYTAKDLKDMNVDEIMNEDVEMDDDMYTEDEYALGVYIKDELITYALEYYLNIAGEDDEEDDYEDDCCKINNGCCK